jgi:vanillate O-demethylase monooxygenase subunit
VIERGPLIWIWMGEPENADQARIAPTTWLTEPGWASSQGYFNLRGNYISLHENLLDLTHLSFIHARSFGTPDYVRAAYETELGDGRFAVKRRVMPTRLPPVWAKPTGLEHDQSARITTSEFVSPALHVVTARFFDTRLTPASRPEFEIKTCHMPTPETHGSTHYFIVHSRDFALDQPDVTKFMHEQLFTAFAEDVVALERLELTLAAPEVDHFEISIESDKATVAMRRYIKARVDAESLGR